MVITKVLGGLGNQMFQYAAGRAVAERHRVPLKLDVTSFDSHRRREYQLQHFNIKAEIANAEEIAELEGRTSRGRGRGIARHVQQVLPYYLQKVVRERRYGYDPNILRVRGNVYLDGYWQDERYFKDVDEEICDEFTLRCAPSNESRSILRDIKEGASISLHVRRGDYAHDPTTTRHHGLCSVNYYRKAVEWIAGHTSNPVFYLFSDEPEWVSKYLKLNYPTCIVGEKGRREAHEDLHLMSHCKHHIISNSTFSWWGAWLSTHPHKKVVAPEKWFASPDRKQDSPVPLRWRRI